MRRRLRDLAGDVRWSDFWWLWLLVPLIVGICAGGMGR